MKKNISLAICFLIVFILSMPAFAEEEKPAGFVPSSDTCELFSANYIIRNGDYKVRFIRIHSGCTLTIDKDATLSVERGENEGTIIVLGTFNAASYFENFNTILAVGCCGGTVTGIWNGYRIVEHFYENGVCVACKDKCSHGNGFSGGKCNNCGLECQHQNGFSDGKCMTCGFECPHTHTKVFTVTTCNDCGTEIERIFTGSVFSGGSTTIICTVVAAVIFGIGGFFLGRKKKPVTENGVLIEQSDEEDE